MVYWLIGALAFAVVGVARRAGEYDSCPSRTLSWAMVCVWAIGGGVMPRLVTGTQGMIANPILDCFLFGLALALYDKTARIWLMVMMLLVLGNLYLHFRLFWLEEYRYPAMVYRYNVLTNIDFALCLLVIGFPGLRDVVAKDCSAGLLSWTKRSPSPHA